MIDLTRLIGLPVSEPTRLTGIYDIDTANSIEFPENSKALALAYSNRRPCEPLTHQAKSLYTGNQIALEVIASSVFLPDRLAL